jgi:hypothetical protein
VILSRFDDCGDGCVDCWMRFRMRIISMGLDDGMKVVVPLDNGPAWRLGCFALTDVRYQLFFFARVYFCNVLCYEQMFNMLDMNVFSHVL